MKPTLFLVSALWVAVPVLAEDAPQTAPSATATEAIPDSSVEVLRLVVTTQVDKQEPVDAVTTAKVGEVLLAFSQIRSGLTETSVVHRWLLDGKTMSEVSLPVKASPWRTWSRKTVHAPGTWTIQVLNASGNVLKEVPLTVQP